MKQLLAFIFFVCMSCGVYAQDFSHPTSTETLKEQTMMFKTEFDDDKSITVVFWGLSSDLGALIEFVDLLDSPKPKDLELQYEIIDKTSLYLLYHGERMYFVKFHKDFAYLYDTTTDKLWLKSPRVI